MTERRIFTWNLHFGGASSKWPILQTAIGAHIAFLQESNNPGDAANVCWSRVPDRAWGSAVVLASGRVTRHDVDGYNGWVVGGEIHGDDFGASECKGPRDRDVTNIRAVAAIGPVQKLENQINASAASYHNSLSAATHVTPLAQGSIVLPPLES